MCVSVCVCVCACVCVCGASGLYRIYPSDLRRGSLASPHKKGGAWPRSLRRPEELGLASDTGDEQGAWPRRGEENEEPASPEGKACIASGARRSLASRMRSLASPQKKEKPGLASEAGRKGGARRGEEKSLALLRDQGPRNTWPCNMVLRTHCTQDTMTKPSAHCEQSECVKARLQNVCSDGRCCVWLQTHRA